ncbi:inositol monophosphatase family protein [Tumidithrix elongata RA019]|uniref:inositol-phosphate phosphatase n=1 Tax=Tumidithrix elongata BACA0141 TaxID=2716417 RepID=A0AAW9PUF2_9CYAN|nr:inositol monophosphatase family protein [Tumidithrix elongata RA019]
MSGADTHYPLLRSNFTGTYIVNYLQDILPFIQHLSDRVGEQLLKDFEQVRIAEQKSDGSLVTKSDRWADEYIKTALQTEFPNFAVLTEESARTLPHTEWCWVVDPLDGTTNFARGIPIWAISLGLLHYGVPVFGFVSIPPLRHSLYGWFTEADRDHQGANAAFLNGHPLQVNSAPPLLTNLGSHLFSSCSRSLEAIPFGMHTAATTKLPAKLRMLGVASYNLLTVATGATIAAVEATPKIWDIAAAWAILQAAGAIWIPLESQPIFPLEFGKNYSDRNFPTLVVSHTELLPIFHPLVSPLLRN